MSLYYGNNVRLVTVDSQFRISGTETDFYYDLKLPSNDFDTVVLHQLSLPRAYYDVDTYCNQFTLNEAGTKITVTLTQAFYTVYSFQTELQKQLNAATTHSWVYTVSYPTYGQPNTNKYTISVTGTGITSSTVIQLIFTSEDCWNQCGFNSSSTNNFVYVSGTTASITSVNCVVISYINRIYLESDICTEAQGNVLSTILIAGNYAPNSFIYYSNSQGDLNSRKYTSQSSNIAHFQFYDRYGNIVLNNGIDGVFDLLFYKKDTTSQVHQEHLLTSNLESLLG